MFVSRDSFAREELHKESLGKGNCDYCGQEKRIIWKYRIESDGGRKNEINGKFCTKQCMLNYNGY